MFNRTARWLGWSLVVVYFVVETAGLWFQLKTGMYMEPSVSRPWLATLTGAIGIWSIIGAVIVSRRPRNLIGWILCTIGIPIGLSDFAFGSAAYLMTIQIGKHYSPVLLVWTLDKI